ncbi:enoyl-CoA hydratase-related protein [Vibrio sp.]|uniref:enoyl-CoA hydratase-related protein n=1 Tax=Vibrio sp. TaxID=678 RepID=UPI003D0A8466
MTTEQHPTQGRSNGSQQQPDYVLCSIDRDGVATLTLNRPEKHNAFDDLMVHQLNEALAHLVVNPDVRVLVLRANGKHFSTGADLNWMKSMAAKSQQENMHDAKRLANLMRRLDRFPHPTIAVVQGYAFGGALGLICCCDIALATPDAQFCLSEVKLGLVPATIGPYICRTLGLRQARRYMLTGERFNAAKAEELGIIHQLIEPLDDSPSGEEVVQLLLLTLMENSPSALQQAKALCHRCQFQPIDQDLIQHTSELIADVRVSEQGQEGLNAFFAKRLPSWHPKAGKGSEPDQD